MKHKWVVGWWWLMAACACVPLAQAHEAQTHEAQAQEAQPIAARYSVTVERPARDKQRTQPTQHIWYFYRDAQRVSVLKGSVDELWFRDAQQRISFARVFHDDARVVDYSTGELLTLHVNANWSALSSLVDPSELAQLRKVAVQGQGRDTRWRLTGKVGQAQLTVDWLPALQLPQRLVRRVSGGATVRMTLLASAPSPLPNWPVVGVRESDYLHLDAADFGDMDYDPVVRKSEALDTRLGWRASHQHD